jgi:hypothetical protein
MIGNPDTSSIVGLKGRGGELGVGCLKVSEETEQCPPCIALDRDGPQAKEFWKDCH